MMGPQYDGLSGKVREKLAAMADQAEVPAET